jgi:RNA polymerase sigma factor (sigma-70 family)
MGGSYLYDGTSNLAIWSVVLMSVAATVIEHPGDEAIATLNDRIASLQPRLLAVARSMGAHDPEDLVQSTLEVAIRRSAQLRDEHSLWSWLVKIQTRQMFRWSRRLRLELRDEQVVHWSPELEELADLRRALAASPPRMRACLVLHYMAELSVADTALALGVSENTVKTHLRLGLRRLKEALQ